MDSNRDQDPSPTSTNAYAESQIPKATIVPRQAPFVASNLNNQAYQSWVLQGFSDPPSPASSSAISTTDSLCPGNNGTVFRSSSGITYQTICGVDYDDNIRPFLLVDSFEACIQKCDAYNYDNHGVTCVAALFIPSRLRSEDDCYLKSSHHPPFCWKHCGGCGSVLRCSVRTLACVPNVNFVAVFAFDNFKH